MKFGETEIKATAVDLTTGQVLLYFFSFDITIFSTPNRFFLWFVFFVVNITIFSQPVISTQYFHNRTGYFMPFCCWQYLNVSPRLVLAFPVFNKTWIFSGSSRHSWFLHRLQSKILHKTLIDSNLENQSILRPWSKYCTKLWFTQINPYFMGPRQRHGISDKKFCKKLRLKYRKSTHSPYSMGQRRSHAKLALSVSSKPIKYNIQLLTLKPDPFILLKMYVMTWYLCTFCSFFVLQFDTLQKADKALVNTAGHLAGLPYHRHQQHHILLSSWQ